MVRDLEKALWAAADKLSNPDVKDEYLVENVFYVPPTASWEYLQHERVKRLIIG